MEIGGGDMKVIFLEILTYYTTKIHKMWWLFARFGNGYIFPKHKYTPAENKWRTPENLSFEQEHHIRDFQFKVQNVSFRGCIHLNTFHLCMLGIPVFFSAKMLPRSSNHGKNDDWLRSDFSSYLPLTIPHQKNDNPKQKRYKWQWHIIYIHMNVWEQSIVRIYIFFDIIHNFWE